MLGKKNKKLIKKIKYLYMDKLLSLIKVSLSYKSSNSSVNVLHDISLTVKKNETLSIMGQSGSGKTSLIMLIAGLEKPSSGKIIFQDRNICVSSEDEMAKIRKKYIGIVFQSFYLMPNYTAEENVTLPLEINNILNPKIKAKKMLDKMGLSKKIKNYPNQLSGGEQQRVAIARSIIMEPSLILADEPTGNLDSENSELITKILFDYTEEKKASLVLVTHDSILAGKTKNKILLKDGRIS